MWTEDEMAALAQTGPGDREAAAERARAAMSPRYRAMLDAGPGNDNSWEWDAAAGLGLFLWRRRRVNPAVVRRELTRGLATLEGEARALSQVRPLHPRSWAGGMVGVVKASALTGAAFAAGGWAAVDWALNDVEAEVARQLGYLDAFADDVAGGRVPLDGRFVRRAMLYGGVGWAFYQMLRSQVAGRRGYTEEQNVLDPSAEHCQGCIAETDRGWQPLGTLSPPGDRTCLSNCRCYLEYRNSETGEVAE